jgi:hypothetical protein
MPSSSSQKSAYRNTSRRGANDRYCAFILLLIGFIFGSAITILLHKQFTMEEDLISKINDVNELPRVNQEAFQEQPVNYKLDCTKVANITVVRELGKGKQKIAYEVILPNGVHAAAKRCRFRRKCAPKQLMARGGAYFQKLHEQYGNQAMEYYGACNFSYVDSVRKTTSNFTQGYTLFIELGEPLLTAWRAWDNQTAPESDLELESLRVIARQYASFNDGSIALGPDNIYAHQYVRTAAGIRHIDFDQTLPQDEFPQNKSILTHNCEILMGAFARLQKNDTRFNCSEAYSRQVGFF